jgi:hypothetical protein
MLEHFHGLQDAHEHQTFYQVCDYIVDYLTLRAYFSFNRSRASMCKRISMETSASPDSTYFVLRFDFSTITASSDLELARENLIASLNSSFEDFYETYATYLGGDVADLCQNIDRGAPNLSLKKGNRLVQNALSRAENEQLAGVRGIYLLIDEYDAFTNSYLEPPDTVDPHKDYLGGYRSRTNLYIFLVHGEAIVLRRDRKNVPHGHLTALLIRCRQCVQYGEKCVIPPEPSRALWFDVFGLEKHTEGNL